VETTTCDVAVVGGGLAGLAAAVTAARAGRRVVLFDAGPLGGRARSTTKDGFTLNLGPHALYRGGEADRVLGDLGIVVSGQPAGTRGQVLVDDVLHRLPGSPVAVARTSLLRPSEKVRLARVFTRLPRIRAADLAAVSVETWLDDEGVTGGLRAFVLAVVRLGTYVDAPERLSAESAVMQLQLAARGPVRYLDGGWAQLVDALAEQALVAGVEVRRGERVLGIDETTAGPVVATVGGSARCGAVVVAAGTPAGAAAVLGGTPPAWAPLGPPTTLSCLDLGLRRLPAARFVLGLDDATYFSVHSPPAHLAPTGGAVVHVARYHRPGAEPVPAAEERQLLEGLAGRLGIGEDDVVTARFLPRMVTSGGFPTAAAGGLAGRPPVAVPGRPGVFVAGDWVGPAGLLADAALASGAGAGTQAAAIESTVTAGR
jgi:phytoene dehydrogenase-like protein